MTKAERDKLKSDALTINPKLALEILEKIPALLDALDDMEYKLQQYKDYMDRIRGLPNCNTCGYEWNCSHMPDPGQNTRINCPLWIAEAGDDT